jgi:hypothetical protein
MVGTTSVVVKPPTTGEATPFGSKRGQRHLTRFSAAGYTGMSERFSQISRITPG